MLVLNALPRDAAPEDATHFEVVVISTGEVLLGGTLPVAPEQIREACSAFYRRTPDESILPINKPVAS